MKTSILPVRFLKSLLKWFVLLFFLAAALLPIVWLFINSFRTNIELQVSSFALPEKWQFSNYAKAIQMASLPRLFFNSVLVSAFAVGVNVIASAMAGFILSREHFRGRDAIYTVLTAGVLIPIISFMVPYFSLVTKIKLYNTLISLVLVYSAVNIPVSIFLVTSFMKSIPKELEEAGIIDGCGFVQRFTKIVFPMSRSGLVTAGTFCFIYAWNDFLERGNQNHPARHQIFHEPVHHRLHNHVRGDHSDDYTKRCRIHLPAQQDHLRPHCGRGKGIA